MASPSWSALSPQGLKPCSGGGFGSMEMSGERADKPADRLSPATPEHITFYKRTRPTKDYKEPSSPKKTGETFSKAKEHSHGPRKTESAAQEAERCKNRKSQPPTKTPASPRTSPLAGQEAAPVLLRTDHQHGPQRRLKDIPSRESSDRERKNGKVDSEVRKSTQGLDGRGERTRPARDQDSVYKRVVVESQHHRPIAGTVKEGDKGAGRDSGQREATGKGKPIEDRDTSKETISKRKTRSSIKDLWSRKESALSPKVVKGREDIFSYVASLNRFPGAPQGPKGPISPGPWKVPSSAKILSQEEVLRDPG